MQSPESKTRLEMNNRNRPEKGIFSPGFDANIVLGLLLRQERGPCSWDTLCPTCSEHIRGDQMHHGASRHTETFARAVTMPAVAAASSMAMPARPWSSHIAVSPRELRGRAGKDKGVEFLEAALVGPLYSGQRCFRRMRLSAKLRISCCFFLFQNPRSPP